MCGGSNGSLANSTLLTPKPATTVPVLPPAQAALPPATIANPGTVGGGAQQGATGFVGSSARQSLTIPMQPQPGVQAAVGGNAGLNIPS